MQIFRTAVLLALLSVSSMGSAQSQSQSSQFGPAYVGVIEAVVDGRRVPLERQTATVSIKTKAFGFGGAQGNIVVAGPASRIRIKSGQNFFFVSRFSEGGADPQSIFQLFIMNIKKNNRNIPYIAVGGMLSGKSKDQSQDSLVPLIFEPYQKEFVKIEPASAIPPGEYFISGPGGLTGYAFGVD